MSLKVIQLKELVQYHYAGVSSMHANMVRKQKIGFPFKYSSHSVVLDTIILEGLLKASEFFLDSDNAKIPDWCDALTFKKFMSKINQNATDFVSGYN